MTSAKSTLTLMSAPASDGRSSGADFERPIGADLIRQRRGAQAERTDVYRQSLQILSGEKLTPLN